MREIKDPLPFESGRMELRKGSAEEGLTSRDPKGEPALERGSLSEPVVPARDSAEVTDRESGDPPSLNSYVMG